MMAEQWLLVGGPANGQLMVMPDGLPFVKVEQCSASPNMHASIKIITYTRRIFLMGGAYYLIGDCGEGGYPGTMIKIKGHKPYAWVKDEGR